MATSPAVSIIMAVFDTEIQLVQRAVRSVLRQSFRDFELIIVDDGSKAALSASILGIATAYDGQISYLRHSNRGQAASVNRVLPLCQGEYVTIIDADDEYKPDHLARCLAEMQHAELIASTAEVVADSEEDYYVPNRYDLRQLIHVDDCILFATLFGKKSIFQSLQFENCYAADAHFYERVAARHRVKKIDLRTYVYYRNIASGTCATLKRQQQQTQQQA